MHEVALTLLYPAALLCLALQEFIHSFRYFPHIFEKPYLKKTPNIQFSLNYSYLLPLASP